MNVSHEAKAAAKPPLHLHFLAHSGSEAAKEVADLLAHAYLDPLLSGGLQVPVWLVPDLDAGHLTKGLPPLRGEEVAIDFDAAQHVLVVVLADKVMANDLAQFGGTGKEWRAFVEAAHERARAGQADGERTHHVLVAGLDDAGFSMAPGGINAIRADGLTAEHQAREISAHVAARAINLLRGDPVPDDRAVPMSSPVRMFISHAKANLQSPRERLSVTNEKGEPRIGPVWDTLRFLDDFPVEPFLDSSKIAPGDDFEQVISQGVREASILLVFQTDTYGSREWCRREVLAMKRAGGHALIIDAIADAESRWFPYLGNVPVIRWRAPIEDEPNDGKERSEDQLRQWREERAAAGRREAIRVVDRAFREALRFVHNRAELEGIRQDEIVCASPPDAAMLAYLTEPGSQDTVLYPDPPLDRHETEVLERLRPDTRFTTPLLRLASAYRAIRGMTVAVGISGSDDVAAFGKTSGQLDWAADSLHLYLLMAGLRISYGGKLDLQQDAETNFTLKLFAMADAYRDLLEAQGVDGDEHKPVINHVPWPLHVLYGAEEASRIAPHADVVKGNVPDGIDAATLFPDIPSLFRPTAEARCAWQRGLTAMRQQQTTETAARVIIGGKLEGFLGLVPGVVEEAWASVHAKRPLFLVGGYGGAARAVIDVLRGRDSRGARKVSEAFAKGELEDPKALQPVPDYEDAKALFAGSGETFRSLDDMAADFRAAAAPGIPPDLDSPKPRVLIFPPILDRRPRMTQRTQIQLGNPHGIAGAALLALLLTTPPQASRCASTTGSPSTSPPARRPSRYATTARC
jgi:hypothetical protein